MYGVHGAYLRDDLSARRRERVAIPESILRRYLGRVGLGTWLLHRKAPGSVDPLAPEARLHEMIRAYNLARGWTADGYLSAAQRTDLAPDGITT